MAVRDDFSAGEVLAAADLNDTFASKPTKTSSATEPTSPAEGDLWFDENTTPPTAKFYDGTSWQTFSAGAANFSNAATGTYTDTGVDYKYLTFTASGTLTVTKAGFADLLILAGGGGTRTGSTYTTGGGAGGMLELSSAYLPAGTLTVTVGAGGSNGGVGPSNHGSDSVLDTFVAVGGGGGGASGDAEAVGNSDTGGSGAGASAASFNRPGLGVTNQGNTGGGVTGGGFAAGGGAGGAASGGTPGVGKASSITGSSVTYAKGGASSGTNTANTGDGGQGDNAGNSGVVIVRVRTN